MKTFIASLAIISVLMVIGFTEAATVRVPKDYPTIQKGIDAASNGDTVLVSDGVYKGESNINLDFKGKAITLKSENGPVNCIIDCENVDNTRGIYFHNKEALSSVVDGFTIRNATISGIFCQESSPTIIGNIIINNSTNGTGGGINVLFNSSPKISGNKIADNSANSTGGGINCWQYSHPIITNNTITGNLSNTGGGGIACSDGSSPRISINTITKNKAGLGGGIWCRGGASATVINNTIKENESSGDGGGVYFGDASPRAEKNIIASNLANRNGGGITCWWGCASRIIDTYISHNERIFFVLPKSQKTNIDKDLQILKGIKGENRPF